MPPRLSPFMAKAEPVNRLSPALRHRPSRQCRPSRRSQHPASRLPASRRPTSWRRHPRLGTRRPSPPCHRTAPRSPASPCPEAGARRLAPNVINPQSTLAVRLPFPNALALTPSPGQADCQPDARRLSCVPVMQPRPVSRRLIAQSPRLPRPRPPRSHPPSVPPN